MSDATQGALNVPLSAFTQADTVRLISTAYIDEPAIAPLADEGDGLDFLNELEAMTSIRQQNIIPLPTGLHPDELRNRSDGFGWTYVNAAFCYTRSSGNRFNSPNRGAWYAAWGEGATQTAQAEIAYHLTRELSFTGTYENITAYQELIAGLTAQMHDLEAFADNDILHPNPEIGHSAGQTLAASLFDNGSQGVLYPSVRRKGGRCLAAFRPNIIQNIRQGQKWVFDWTGTSEPDIRAG